MKRISSVSLSELGRRNTLLVVIVCVGFLTTTAVGSATDYTTWCTGACDSDITTVTQPGAALQGGVDVEEAFIWQILNANGGDFLVLSASYDDYYVGYIYNLSVSIGHPLNSMRTLRFENGAASYDPVVLDYIRNAETIFFEGGDQSRYLDYWMGTEVQSIIQSKLNTTTIGGTSAGLAILGNWIYSAEYESAQSNVVLQNPYDQSVTIAPYFLQIPFMDTIITDTHFVVRNRMGRMLTFEARIMQDSASSSAPARVVRGVGVDEYSALLLNVTTGDVLVVGNQTSYVCEVITLAEVCKRDTPLTYTNISCMRLDGSLNDTYSFRTFTGSGFSYINTIISGEFQDNPYGEGQNFDDYYPYVPVDPASEDGGNDSGWNSIPLYGRALIITVFGCVAAAVAAILYTKLRISKSATKETDGIILLN